MWCSARSKNTATAWWSEFLGNAFQVKSSQVVYFRNPSGRTSMKEHLVRHGSKHKIQVHTTKRNKHQQKQNRTHFQNKKQRETRERSLTKTKARASNS